MSAAKAFKNVMDMMDPFVPTEGIYVIKNTNALEQIADIVPAATNYSGAGAFSLTVIPGQDYAWTKGASDTNLVVNDGTNDTAQMKTLTNNGTFRALVSTVTLNGTASAGMTATVVPQRIYLQKLWLYPAKSVAAGILGANTGGIHVGKSGLAATKYLPDALATTDLPIKYEFPPGQKLAFLQVLIAGTAGDGVYYQFT